MPIYEFHCKECNKDFKVLRRANDIEDVRCTICGSLRTMRLLSVTAPTASNSLEASISTPFGGGG